MAPDGAPPSPGATGAMDTLLEKLRAAAPQTRDTRDRRRRARLKDRHQVRVASGQKIPETGENVDAEGNTIGEDDRNASGSGGGGENGALLSPTVTNEGGSGGEEAAGAASEGEDIADRAASMLQGLRDPDAEPPPARDDTLRVRRRRESADDERARRRRRRGPGGVGGSMAIPEEGEEMAAGGKPTSIDLSGVGKGLQEAEPALPTPTTVVVPPSPTGSEKGRKLGWDSPG